MALAGGLPPFKQNEADKYLFEDRPQHHSSSIHWSRSAVTKPRISLILT